jgi:hypothetical protein
MNKDDRRILRARSGWSFKEWIVFATILILAANAAPAIPGSTVSGIPSGADVDRNAKRWIGTWATAAQPFVPKSLETYRNQSLRLIVHTSAGGTRVRVKISNTYGDGPLLIGGAHVARRTAEAEIDPRSDRMLRFQAESSTTVAAGSMVVSDPVEMDVPALSDLAVSLFLPQRTEAKTSHKMAKQTSYVSPETGDSTAAVKFPVAKTIQSWPFLTAVDVEASLDSAAIVAFGSSLTDGDGTTADTNGRWPDVLAERLQKGGAGGKVEIGVLNEGIIGNRLLYDSPKGAGNPFGGASGEAGLARFERDVLRSLDREGAPQAVVEWGLFRIPKSLKCVERREAGRGAGVHAPQAEFTFRTYCRQPLPYRITEGLPVIRPKSQCQSPF